MYGQEELYLEERETDMVFVLYTQDLSVALTSAMLGLDTSYVEDLYSIWREE